MPTRGHLRHQHQHQQQAAVAQRMYSLTPFNLHSSMLHPTLQRAIIHGSMLNSVPMGCGHSTGEHWTKHNPALDGKFPVQHCSEGAHLAFTSNVQSFKIHSYTRQ
jgi:hypothetical protein